MRNSRNTLFLLVVVLVAILVTAACGGGNETPTLPPLAVPTSTPDPTPYLIIDASKGVGFGYTWGIIVPTQSAEIVNPCQIKVNYIGIIAAAPTVDIDIAGGNSTRVVYNVEGKQDPITCGPGALYVYRDQGVVFVEYQETCTPQIDHGQVTLLSSTQTETTFQAIGAEVGPVTFTMEPWQGEYLAEFIATHNPQIPYTFLVGCEEPRQVTYLAYGGEMWSADEGLTEFVVDKLFER